MKSEVTVVMYHYVRDLKNSRYPNIKGLDIEKFKKQINNLKKEFKHIIIDGSPVMNLDNVFVDGRFNSIL